MSLEDFVLYCGNSEQTANMKFVKESTSFKLFSIKAISTKRFAASNKSTNFVTLQNTNSFAESVGKVGTIHIVLA